MVSSNYLELENQVQDQIKEEESTVEEVDQSGIRSSPQEVPDSQGLEDHVPDRFKEKESEETEGDQSRTGSNPKEMVVKIVVEVISCNVSDSQRCRTNHTGDRGMERRNGCEDCSLDWG